MTDSDFETIFQNESIPERTEYQKIIDDLFSILPLEIRDNLANFISEYDVDSVKYNKFAIDFNNFLKRELVSMLGGDPNLSFFNIRTHYHSSSEFWNGCTDYVMLLDKGNLTDERLGYIEFVKISMTVLGKDGFRVASEIYN